MLADFLTTQVFTCEIAVQVLLANLVGDKARPRAYDNELNHNPKCCVVFRFIQSTPGFINTDV